MKPDLEMTRRITGFLWGLGAENSLLMSLFDDLLGLSTEASEDDIVRVLILQKEPVRSQVMWYMQVGIALGGLYPTDDMLRRKIMMALASEASEAIACGVAMGHLVSLCFSNEPIQTYLPRLYGAIEGMDDGMDYGLLRIGHVLAWVDIEKALAHLIMGDRCEAMVIVALYCVLKSASSIEGALGIAQQANMPGVVTWVRGLMGARLGIPELAKVPEETQILSERMAERIYL